MKTFFALAVLLFASTCYADVEIITPVKSDKLASLHAKLPGNIVATKDIYEMQLVRRPDPQINDHLIHTPQYRKVKVGSQIKVVVPDAKLVDALTVLKGYSVQVNFLETNKPYKLGQ